jgi:hypothetical protein
VLRERLRALVVYEQLAARNLDELGRTGKFGQHLELAFLTTVTVFNAPQNVTLDELRIESYFPLDDATARACERLAQED